MAALNVYLKSLNKAMCKILMPSRIFFFWLEEQGTGNFMDLGSMLNLKKLTRGGGQISPPSVLEVATALPACSTCSQIVGTSGHISVGNIKTEKHCHSHICV